ncbi:MAG: polyprenyl synthetase family protein [Ignavibacteriaceae bacterium]|jgi:geranylgeranyl diphosphate synthase type II
MGKYEKAFKAFLDRERNIVDKKLSEALENRKPQSLYEPGYYIIESGGKRLRPLLVLLSVKAVGGKLNKAYNAAAAVELLHNFTLVHDDIMDNADIRRNIPTIHKKYDVSTAILAGDSLISVAYEYLLKDCNGIAKKVLAAFTKSLIEVCEGQSLDKEYELKEAVSIEEYILMIEKKTAALIEMCCITGAIIGGGEEKEIKCLAKFGKNIGIAFQIQDDLLDIVGNEDDFGKFVGGDLIEGKKTFLFLKALEMSGGKDKEKLLAVIKNKGIKPELIQSYKELYQRLNILKEAENEIQHYTNLALKSIKKLKNEKYRDFLALLADSLIKRKK